MGFNKIMEPLADVPVLVHTIRRFDMIEEVTGIILAVNPGCEEQVRRDIVEKYSLAKVTQVVAGGETRVDSVWNALQAIDTQPDIVAVHDAARPFVSRAVIRDSIAAAGTHGGAIVADPVVPTIKEVNDSVVITRTIDRHMLRAAATPQAFQYSIFLDAFTRFMQSECDSSTITDDAQIIEQAGGTVICVDSNPENIKLTTPFDWQLAQACGREWLLQ